MKWFRSGGGRGERSTWFSVGFVLVLGIMGNIDFG